MITKAQHDEMKERLQYMQECIAWFTEQSNKIECVAVVCNTCGFNRCDFCSKHENELAGFNDGCEAWFLDNIPF